MEIRFAKLQDVSFILSGVQENAQKSFPYFKKIKKTAEIHRRRIRSAFRDTRQKIFVAIDSMRIVGFLWLRLETTEISLERFGYLQSLWVHSKWRRRGVGSALLKHGEAYLTVKKYPKMVATYTASNLSMQSFSAKNGFKVRRIQVEKTLKSPK